MNPATNFKESEYRYIGSGLGRETREAAYIAFVEDLLEQLGGMDNRRAWLGIGPIHYEPTKELNYHFTSMVIKVRDEEEK